MSVLKAWTDVEVVAELTREVPLARYCLIGGRIYTWSRLKYADSVVWLPLYLLVEDDSLSQAAPGAMCRAGVKSFRSAEEAVAWGRTIIGSLTLEPNSSKCSKRTWLVRAGRADESQS